MAEQTEDIDLTEPRGCLATLWRFFGIRLRVVEELPSVERLPYRLRSPLLSPAELSFYHVALQALPKGYTIAVKPRLGDVLFVPRGTKGNWAFDSKIQRKHVDFLICESQTMTPRLVIELDDKSHRRSDRQERDVFIDQALDAAGLDILHVPATATYVLNELRSTLAARLAAAEQHRVQPQGDQTSPLCPTCREPLVMRTASKGSQRGQQFWGCQNYPTCRLTLPIDKGPTK